ncbi:ATP-binding protein [Rhodococcus zopfii]|uniref:ATP-binding protein n=1 Tax=Rhodococcus zopfii TaxID=43772 RepID=UPI001F0D5E68|nr:ATP-binding protein [Rhodococcus zopfii]
MTQIASHPVPAVPDPIPGGGGIPTTLSVPALHAQLPVIRMLTEVVAMHGGCTLDQVSDLKLAVDQVCTLLIEAAAPATEITCRFHKDHDVFRIEVTATTIERWRPAPDSLEWRILELLADTLSANEEPEPTGKAARSTVELSIGMPA